MHNVSKQLQKFSSGIITICLFIMIVTIAIQILFRNIFRIPCVWTDEIARYALIWMTMVGASLQVRKKGHFLVSIFIDTVKNKKFFNILINIIILFVSLGIFIWGIKFVATGIGTISAAAHINMEWIYLAMPVSAFLMIFYIIEMILEELGILPIMVDGNNNSANTSEVIKEGK